MKQTLPLIAIALTTPAFAGETRELAAHEHGVGALNIAIDGGQIAMELHAPGADIVGFEHAAKSAEDRTAIETAVAALARPLDLFGLPTSAECTVIQASARLETEDHDDHDAHSGADGHDQEEHSEDHAEKHSEEHTDHSEEPAEVHNGGDASHSEFRAEYMFDCSNPDEITSIKFTYFDTFENARELEVQVVTGSGAKAFEVERDTPSLDLRGMF